MRALLALAMLTAANGSVDAREASPAEPDTFTFVAGGDMIGPDRVLGDRSDPQFEPIATLFRAADLGFANQEGAILDPRGHVPAAENGGGYPAYPPGHASDLGEAGIRLVSLANNHATDWGTDGLLATMKALDLAGVAHAGAGRNAEQARAPRWIDTKRGRAALVSVASTFPPMSEAGTASKRGGRPGISVLHVRQVKLVKPVDFQALQRIAGPVGAPTNSPDELRIADQVFRQAPRAGLTWEMAPDDHAAVLEAVRQAQAGARFVVFTIHAHETAGNHDDIPPGDFEPMILHRANEAPSPDDPRPAGFAPRLFHEAIDAGADAVVRTGPHVLGGIEIYKGRPIFYSLGFLFFDFNGGARTYKAPGGAVKRLPDSWYETVIPVSTFRGGEIATITLHPAMIDPKDGLPHPVKGADARRILGHVQQLSQPYGTHMVIAGDVGVIRPQATASTSRPSR